MQNIYYFILFIFWALFWSFASVLIYRLKSAEKWILNWRSHCQNCKKTLWALDLIPIFSWLFNLWKCKYCKTKISYIYPFLEIFTWIIFVSVWVFLTDFQLILNLNFLEIIKLLFWLSISFITILYIFYDILFLEIHEWIMLTWISLAFLWVLINSFSLPLLETISVSNLSILQIIISSAISLIILTSFYLIMLKELKVIYDFLLIFAMIWLLFLSKNYFFTENFYQIPMISSIIWAFWIFIFFFLQIVLSKWKALWWWDLRIWMMIWLLFWINFSFIWIAMWYLVWSIIWIFIIIKNFKKKEANIVPFWPFLWIWFFLTLFFHNYITIFIEKYFLLM